MNHRSHLWLMAALAGLGVLMLAFVPGGAIGGVALGLPLLLCLAMLAGMAIMMWPRSGASSERPAAEHVTDAPAPSDRAPTALP